jgi:hypothetical protein
VEEEALMTVKAGSTAVRGRRKGPLSRFVVFVYKFSIVC